jgi:hypothetical protein
MRVTTATLAMLDAQDVFDIVGWHLLHQNARATAFDGVKCMYRAAGGRRCAIGWIMPDEIYTKSLEFYGVRDLAARLSTDSDPEHIAFADFLYRHMPLLRDLQGMHDAHQPEDWPLVLRDIARSYDLNAMVVSQHMPAPVKQHSRSSKVTQPVTRVPAIENICLLTMPKPGEDHVSEKYEVAYEV